MLTKGFITAIPTGNSNKYQVRLPFFENAVENSSEVIYEATLNYTPGIVGGYNVGDCVYCLFEDNDGGRPVISGKLYTKDGNYTGALVLTDNLTVNKSATLPPNTTVGNVTADNIKALTGVRSNLQWQLNDIDDRLSHIGGTVDTTMSDTSTNPVQNMVIKSYVDSHSSITDYDNLTNIPITNLATGAVLYGKTTGLCRVISGNTYKYYSTDAVTTATEDILFNIYNDTANSKTYAVKIQSMSSMQWVEITSTGSSEYQFIKQTSTITAGTNTKITYDSQGLVTAGTGLSTTDIPDLSATYATVSSVPTQTSDLTNDSGFITNAVSDLTNYYTSSATDILLANKVDKITGKGLSTNDYTDAEKTKLTGIATGAEVNVIDDIKVNGTSETITDKSVNITVPTAISDLTDTTATTPVAKAITAGSITTESKTVTYSSMTSGVTVNWMVAYKSGNVVSIYFKFTKSASTSSGSDVLTCTLTNMSGWLPPYDAESFGYYSSCSFGIRLESDGSLTVRNASASSRTLSDGIQFHLTYVI